MAVQLKSFLNADCPVVLFGNAGTHHWSGRSAAGSPISMRRLYAGSYHKVLIGNVSRRVVLVKN